MTVTLTAEPRALAESWLEVDPDAGSRAVVKALLDGDETALERRFGSRLAFGTAGLRGQIGAGPTRMSQVLVRVVAAALADRILQDDDDDPHVVVGYDARHKSSDFAEDTARVCAARGVRCTLLPEPLPTPVLAFTVRRLGASAGVMVTASHNPRADNGYKVYWRGGAQISAPIDQQISDLIDATPLMSDADLAPMNHPRITSAGPDAVHAYLDAAVGLLRAQGPRTARVAYTPLHGVGGATLTAAFAAAGFPTPAVVDTQAAPDPDFPTAPFPNPEETGVLDPLIALATSIGADVALANDPDADRLAVAVPNGPSWRLLTGDELGSLLAEYLLAETDRSGKQALVINTVVSSRLLSDIARHHGAHYTETLTGFKWIMHARQQHPDKRFVLGYEEALGYCAGEIVGDKDGISAALIIAEMVSELSAKGRTLADLLDDMHQRYGVHATGQRSIRFEATTADTPVMTQAMEALRQRIPSALAGRPVVRSVDLARGTDDLAPTDGVILEVDGGRIVVRPSGTEPKMKVYGEATVATGNDLATARAGARALLNQLLDDAVTLVAAPERPRQVARDSSGDGDLEDRAAALLATEPIGAPRAVDLRLLVRCMELTSLAGDQTPGTIRAMAAQARRPDPADPTVGPAAAVCVYPSLVALTRELVGSGGSIQVVAAAGAFPHGLSTPAVRAADIAASVDAGADEIEVVLNRSAMLSGQTDHVVADLETAREAAAGAALKVSIDAGGLGSPEVVRDACAIAVSAGADLVSASAGRSATNAAAAILAVVEELADHHARTGGVVGLKVAGEHLTAPETLGYIAMVRTTLGDDWLTPQRLRFSASGLLNLTLADLVVTEGALRR